jgi:hypothetical protein
MGRVGRRRKHLLYILKETGGYWKLKEVALTRKFWKIRLGRGYGPVIRINTRPNQPVGHGQCNARGHSVRLLARISEM